MASPKLEIKVVADRGGGYVAYALKDGKIMYSGSDVDDPQAALKELALRMFMLMEGMAYEVSS